MKQVLCLACRKPREVEWQKPGETKYRQCVCGEIGILVIIDGVSDEEETHARSKKAFRQLYERR